MTRKQEIRAIIAILSFSVVLMGIVAVGSGLSVIGAHFKDVSQTQIQMIISLPSIVIIFATLVAGKLQEYISKKTVLLIGLFLFVAAGVAPAFMENFTLILIMRGLFGVGLGFLQPMSSAIVSYFFDGEKRDKIMGWQSAAQQVGASIMSMVGGVFAGLGWNVTFLVHAFALIPLVFVPILLPKMKSARKDAEERGEKAKVTITRGALMWTAAEFFFFLISQVNAIYNSYLVAEKGIGTPADLGFAYIFSCATGLVCGIMFSKIRAKLGRYTYATGIFALAITDIIIAYSTSIATVYVANLFVGISFGLAVPIMIVGVSSSVNKFSGAMAMAIAMSAKAIAQFFCAYIFTPLADACVSSFGMYGRNQWVYIICASVLIVATAVITICCAGKNKRERLAAA